MFEIIEIIDKDELINFADQLLGDLKDKTLKTIEAADDTDLEPLNEEDVKAIIWSHVEFLIGPPADAHRANDLEDLIRVNCLR